MDTEDQHATGGHAFLTSKESKANEILLQYKNQSISDGIEHPESYAPGMHFFNAKPLIDKSVIFRILKAMPKGSILHLHNSAAVSSRWVIKNLTYRSEAKLCDSEGKTIFTARSFKSCSNGTLQNIPAMRLQNDSVQAFDLWLESLINLKLRESDLMYVDMNTIWVEFEQMFTVLKDFLGYKPFFEAYANRLLREFFEDNVMYLELRMSLSKLYDSDEKIYDEIEVVRTMAEIVKSFKEKNPDFIGAKVIFSKHRGMDSTVAQNYLKTYNRLKEEFPETVVGFDIVGQEDINKPLSNFIDELQQYKKSVSYYFHAGETNGYGNDADLNLIDAVLLNSRRIGHGYALFKHPVLRKIVKSKGIALEVCPISNQVLRLLSDLRNHPAVSFVSENLPLVISSDDPGFWDSIGVSYDFYYVFMAFAPRTAGIGFLKQIVWDSVRYSTLTSNERTSYAEILQQKWDNFIDAIIEGKYNQM
ncbi:adenosine deaminase 2-like isoform X2 [Uranotaenia lowii]|nr:adenosine deaminase 2-like isoform X2 [Uranotaenia lowii]